MKFSPKGKDKKLKNSEKYRVVLRCLLRCLIRVMFKLIDFMYVFLPPANKVWGKVIFSVACVKNSVHRRGTSSGTPPRGRYTQPPWAGTPGQVPPGRYPPGLIPPGHVHPPQVHPLAGTPPGQVHPQDQYMLGDMGNKRAVRILLECILVTHVCHSVHRGGVGFPACTGKGGWLPSMHWEKRAVCILLECFLVDYSYIRTILKQKCAQERQ